MSEVSAIAGQLMGFKTLADGTLRISIDLSETESLHFLKLFPQIHCQVAIAPLAQGQTAQAPAQDYGPYAQALFLSVFFGVPEVWRAAGTDAEFLDFVRQQKCCARGAEPCDTVTPPCDPAHVWRLRDGFGKGLKGPYAAVPFCRLHHTLQHQHGEDAVGGRAYMEQKAQEMRRAWVWSVIKDDLRVASMRDAEPARVLAWCQKRGIDRYLPAALKEVA